MKHLTVLVLFMVSLAAAATNHPAPKPEPPAAPPPPPAQVITPIVQQQQSQTSVVDNRSDGKLIAGAILIGVACLIWCPRWEFSTAPAAKPEAAGMRFNIKSQVGDDR